MDEIRIEIIERMIVICDECNEFVWNFIMNDVLFVELKWCRFFWCCFFFDDDFGDFIFVVSWWIEILAYVGVSVRIEF